MSAVDNGGPAFHGTYLAYPKDGPGEGVIYADSGMTLRDWFAGQALASWPMTSRGTASVLATSCYELADAMLTARQSPSAQADGVPNIEESHV